MAEPREPAASLAHDLRGPLQTIQTWTAILEQSLRDAPASVERALAGIRLAVQQELDVIERHLEPKRDRDG